VVALMQQKNREIRSVWELKLKRRRKCREERETERVWKLRGKERQTSPSFSPSLMLKMLKWVKLTTANWTEREKRNQTITTNSSHFQTLFFFHNNLNCFHFFYFINKRQIIKVLFRV